MRFSFVYLSIYKWVFEREVAKISYSLGFSSLKMCKFIFILENTTTLILYILKSKTAIQARASTDTHTYTHTHTYSQRTQKNYHDKRHK